MEILDFQGLMFFYSSDLEGKMLLPEVCPAQHRAIQIANWKQLLPSLGSLTAMGWQEMVGWEVESKDPSSLSREQPRISPAAHKDFCARHFRNFLMLLGE